MVNELNKKRNYIIGYLYLIPALVIFILFTYWPAIYSFYLSFFNTTTSTGHAIFVGLSNYAYLFRTGQLPYAFLTAFEYSLVRFIFAFVISIALFAWVESRGKYLLKNAIPLIIIPVLAISLVYPALSFWGGNTYMIFLWVLFGILSFYFAKNIAFLKLHMTLFLLSILGFYIVAFYIGNRMDLYTLFFDIAQNNSFVMSIWNTFYFVIIDVPLTIGISLAAGLLMKNLPFFKAFFRTAFFAPYVASIVAVSLLWLWLFNYHYGIFNFMLSWFGIPPINWLNSAALTMPTVAILSIWEYFGYYGLIFLSGLQNIDQEYYEAAEIEGANSFQRFVYITWPLLSPITFFVMVVSLINAFQVFTQVYVLYNQMPGPYANSGLTMVFYIYNTFYNEQQMGLASAAAYILLGIIMVLTLIQFRTTEKRVEYNI